MVTHDLPNINFFHDFHTFYIYTFKLRHLQNNYKMPAPENLLTPLVFHICDGVRKA